MNRRFRATVLATALVAVGGACSSDTGGAPDAPESWEWTLPAHFPIPSVPDDNAMSSAKVELGRSLFYDVRLSGNQTFACASCHDQSLAFTDGLGRSIGSTGEVHPRGAMSLANIAYASRLNWANPLVDKLEVQALTPMFGEDPIEMGMGGREDELVSRLLADTDYPTRFAEAFPGVEPSITIDTVMKALASFQRTLISADSAYDRFVGGDSEAMSASAVRGMDLFFSERLECFHCHGGFNFSDSVSHAGLVFSESTFHNTGLYNIDGRGAYPSDNRGLMELTENPLDMGRFRAPTLRNIAVTAPYFHDGSAATLEDVIDHYSRGGRLIEDGPHAGDGRESPLRNEFIIGFELESSERVDLIAFLEALTDHDFLTNPALASPFDGAASD